MKTARMTASEFKARLANGDRLAVVMEELFVQNGYFVEVALQHALLRRIYAKRATAILAALASAEAKRQ